MTPDTQEWQQVKEKQPPRQRARAEPWLLPAPRAAENVSVDDDADSCVYQTSPLLVSRRQRLWDALLNCVAEELTHGRAFLFLPVFLGLGAIWWFSRPQDLAAVPIVLVGAGCGFLWWRTRFYQPATAACLGIATLAMAGMVLADLETSRLDTIVLDGPVTTLVRGRVVSTETNASGHQRYVIALEETREPRLKRMPQQVALLARGKHTPFKSGDRVEGRARLSPPSGPALPGLNDFAKNSYFSGTGAIGYFYRPPTALQSSTHDNVSLWEQGLQHFNDTTQRVRNGISDRIRFWVPGDAGAFGAAIVTGERRGLSAKANDDLRISGLAHIISISGLHMALAGGLFFVGIRRLLSLVPGLAETWSVKKIAAAGAIATTTGYFLISGYEVAAQRAYLMMVIMLSAAFFDRPVLSLRNTAIAALLVVVISPSQVMGPSLQMSFAATFALIAGFDLWRQRGRLPQIVPSVAVLRPLKPLGKLIGGILMTSALGGLSTAMFSAAHFHRVGLHGLEANLLASPIISMVVMPCAMIGVLVMPFGLEEWPLRLMGYGLEGVLAIGSHIAGWGNGFTFGRFEGWFLPVSAIGLLVLTLLKTRLRLAGALMIAFACGFEALKPEPPQPHLAVTEDGQLVGILRPSDANAVTIAINKKRPPDFIYNQWAAAIDITEAIAAETLPKPRATKSQNSNSKKDRVAPDVALAEMKDALTKANGNRDVFYCRTNDFCIARLSNDWTVTLVQNRDFSSAACVVADLIISTQSTYYAACKPGVSDTSNAIARTSPDTPAGETDAMPPQHAGNSIRSMQSKAEISSSSGKPSPQSGDRQPVLIDRDTLRQRGAMEITLGDLPSRSLHVAATFHGEQRPWTRHRYYDWRTNTYATPDDSRLENAEPETAADDASDNVE
ncbi:ComEC/Rec2-related protein [Agrobacterium vitis]|nr:ComEC/Rec2-related protein [Agrobacterium vitis]MBE1438789.1 ComEC/Rec2-related protein [Agrobacterium vitis]